MPPSSQLWTVTINATVCDGCWEPIIGERNKCSVCCDFDLCSKCMIDIGHDEDHEIIKSTTSFLPPATVCSGCLDPIVGYAFQCKLCDNYKLCITCLKLCEHFWAHGEIRQELDVLPFSAELWDRTARGIVCDGCLDPIFAKQGFHCAICPNYDLCNDCFAAKKHFQHRGAFIKCRSEEKPHINIACDSCANGNPIFGYRFKCKKCANYNLCSTCFKNGVHKDYHLPKSSSASSLSSTMKNAAQTIGIECAICIEPYDAESNCPRQLPCGHTICTNCIDPLVMANTISCPKCRRVHTNIANSEALPKNFELIDALTKIANTDNAIDTSSCDNCGSFVAIEKLRYCLTCLKDSKIVKEYLCADCCLSNHDGHQFRSDFEIRKKKQQDIQSKSLVLEQRLSELQISSKIAQELDSAEELRVEFLTIQVGGLLSERQKMSVMLPSALELSAGEKALAEVEQFIVAANSANEGLLRAVKAYREQMIDLGLNVPALQECAALACQLEIGANGEE